MTRIWLFHWFFSLQILDLILDFHGFVNAWALPFLSQYIDWWFKNKNLDKHPMSFMSLTPCLDWWFKNKNQDKHPMPFTSLAAYPLTYAAPFRERALDGHDIRQQMEGVSKHKIIKEKDSLYVFILAYNESLFFEWKLNDTDRNR